MEGIGWEKLSTAGILEVDLRCDCFGWRGLLIILLFSFGNVLLSDEFMVYFVDV
jgi:hypothetical protein